MMSNLDDCLDDDGRWQVVRTDWFNPGWWEDALCVDIGPETFFGFEGDNGHHQYPLALRAQAHRACFDCPSRESCLKDEMDRLAPPYIKARSEGKSRFDDDDCMMSYGVRGGTGPDERVLLRDGPAKFATCPKCDSIRVVHRDAIDIKFCSCFSRSYVLPEVKETTECHS